MTTSTKLSDYYESFDGGLYVISSQSLKNFASQHPERVLDVSLWGKPAKAFLFDKPFHLAGKMGDPEGEKYRLHHIRLNELPGWPPKLPPSGGNNGAQFTDCTFLEARLHHGDGQEGIELSLEHRGKKLKAWHVDCPVSLLRCVEATLNRPELQGKGMAELQDVKLIGCE